MKNTENIVNLVTGDIDPGVKKMILSEIEAKTESREIFNRIKIAWALLSSTKQMKEYDVEGSYLDLKAKIAGKRIPLHSMLKAWHKYAAVLVVFLSFAALLLFSVIRPSLPGKDPGFTYTSVTTEYGQRSLVVLPDSSKVWLNSGTTISCPSEFNTHRLVSLAGEAFFEVREDHAPFIVSTDYVNVEVKGTSFNVKAFADDNSFETTLVEGIVELKDANMNHVVTLNPGQHAMKTDSGLDVKEVDTNYYTSWKEGKLMFRREPFPDFMKKLERWFDVKIEYDDPGLDTLRYTGTIEQENVSEVMEMIRKTVPVSVSYNNKCRIYTLQFTNNDKN